MSDYASLERRLDQLCRAMPAFGASLAVIRDERTVYTAAVGRYADQAMIVDTPIAVASLTKPLFAYGALKLIERGVLDLDAPLARYLPEPYLPDEPYLPLMTARHALSHTTGLPNWRAASGLRAATRPGAAFHYSTEGLLYLQAVVERLTQEPLDDYVQHNLLKPFGMAHSRLVPEDLSIGRSYLPPGLRAYGGLSLHTTASDYAQFMLEMLRADQGDEFRLAAATIEHMLSPHVGVGDHDRLSWGLGWGLQDANKPEEAFWHFGVKSGRTHNFAIGCRAERTGVVVLTSGGGGLNMCQDIAQIILGPEKSLPAFGWLLPPERWRGDGKVALSDTDNRKIGGAP